MGAVLFAVITGLLMAFIFMKDDAARAKGEMFLPEDRGEGRGRTLICGQTRSGSLGRTPESSGKNGLHSRKGKGELWKGLPERIKEIPGKAL